MKNKNIIKILITLNILIILSLSINSATYEQFENNLDSKILEYTQNFGSFDSEITFVNISTNECADAATVTLTPSPIEAENASADIVLITDLSPSMRICMEGGGDFDCDNNVYWGKNCNFTNFEMTQPNQCDCSEYDELGICFEKPHFISGNYSVTPMLHLPNEDCELDDNNDSICPGGDHLGLPPQLINDIYNENFRNVCPVDYRPITPPNIEPESYLIYASEECNEPLDQDTGIITPDCTQEEYHCSNSEEYYYYGSVYYEDETPRTECRPGEDDIGDTQVTEHHDAVCEDGWEDQGRSGWVDDSCHYVSKTFEDETDVCNSAIYEENQDTSFRDTVWIIPPLTCADINLYDGIDDPVTTDICFVQDECNSINQTIDSIEPNCRIETQGCEDGEDEDLTYIIDGQPRVTDPENCPVNTEYSGDDYANTDNCININSPQTCGGEHDYQYESNPIIERYPNSCPDDYDIEIFNNWSTQNNCEDSNMDSTGETRPDLNNCDWHYLSSCPGNQPMLNDEDTNSFRQQTPCPEDEGYTQEILWSHRFDIDESEECPNGRYETGETSIETYEIERDECETGEEIEETNIESCEFLESCEAPTDYSTGITEYQDGEPFWNCEAEGRYDSGIYYFYVYDEEDWRSSCDFGGNYHKIQNDTIEFEWVSYESECSSPILFDTNQENINYRTESTDLSLNSDTIVCYKINPYDEDYQCYDLAHKCYDPEYQCIDEMRNCTILKEECCIRTFDCSGTINQKECGRRRYECSRDEIECCGTEYECEDYICTIEELTCCETEYQCGIPQYECCYDQYNCCYEEIQCGQWNDNCCQGVRECEITGDLCAEPLQNCCRDEKECRYNMTSCEKMVDNCCENQCQNDTLSSKIVDYPIAIEFGCPIISTEGQGNYTNSSKPVPNNSCLDSNGNETFYCELENGRDGSCEELTCVVVREKLAKYLDKDFVLNVTNESNENTRVSLISYATNAIIDEPLTHNTTNLISEIESYDSSNPARGARTCISCALRNGIDQLINSDNALASKSIVLMTDGVANRLLDGTNLDEDEYYLARNEIKDIACNETELTSATSNQIIIYTIAFGSDASDIETLQNISACTNGTFYQSSDPEGLKAIYEDIQGRINESNVIPKIDINNDNFIDYNMGTTQLSTQTVWNSACGTALASCDPLSTVLNYGLNTCNNDGGLTECYIEWNTSTLTPGNLTFSNLNINTFEFSSGPIIVDDDAIGNERSIDCDDFTRNNAGCGNGNIDSQEPFKEQCDDGCMTDTANVCEDSDNGDGCSRYCTIEPSIPNPEFCEHIQIRIHENQRYLLNANHYVDDLDDADYDLTWTWIQISDKNLTISLDTYEDYNIIEVLPEMGWNGWEEVNFTVTDDSGQYDIACINFTVAPVPDYGIEKINTTRLLISKGKMITGYNENIAGEIQSWGPYLVTIKVWEKDTRKNE
jgi:hypothetical protein